MQKTNIHTFLDKENFILLHGLPKACTSLEYDSRHVKEGSAFFAFSGLHTDGKLFIEDAIKNGAKTVLYEGELTSFVEDICYVCVKNIKEAMAQVAKHFFESPDESLAVIGVTGTEGKSSTTAFITSLLNLCGKRAGFISTVSYSYGDEIKANPAHQTTPESSQVYEHLKNMKDGQCLYAVVESSSHGLSHKTARLLGVNFDVGICLNIKEEHLEFHKTIECYTNDKANLFRMIGNKEGNKKSSIVVPTFAVINEDDEHTPYLKTVIKGQWYSFTHDEKKWKKKGSENIFLISDIKETDKLEFSLKRIEDGKEKTTHIKTSLYGAYNADNITASIIVVSKLTKISIENLHPLIEKIEPIKGRMASIDEGQDFEVIIDYAHTPSSFLAIFPSIKKRVETKGAHLISLFGSAGERDIVKRALQGNIACQYSDIIILTNEDPRGEDEMSILEMIAEGIEGKKRGDDLFLIPKREDAIKKAFLLAKRGDVVLLLGKSHENSIIFKDHVQPYDEEAVARKLLKGLQ